MTDARMKVLPARPCVFGCGLGGDDFNHYADCPIVWAAANRLGIMQVPCREQRPRVLLVLDGEFSKHLRLAFLHACMILVHILRGPHAHIADSHTETYIRNNFRDIISRSSNLKASFRELCRLRGVNGSIAL